MNLFKESESVIIFNVKNDKKSLEEFLSNKEISGRLFRRLYKQKNIFVNGNLAKKNRSLKKGDIISLVMEDEEESINPEPIPLDIIYEDFDLILINKHPYTIVHPTKNNQNNTIANGISYYFKSNGIKKKIRFVNRLDMNTSGILVVAKSSFAHQQMALQFERNEVEKKYIALVAGVVEKDEDIIDLPIEKGGKNIKNIVTENGKESITKYKVIERYLNATLLEVQIFTGKNHQIRVHLNHIGHPIIGDTLYYKPDNNIERQALHSYYLKVNLPRIKKVKEFKAPLPDDIKKLVQHLRKNGDDKGF
ncbi:RluA family pseudouridine synthase [Schnuerera sp. xch1]|uniref:RluA family pseudouridine synthase n=1 Tax=Schnuerera sp. xch1 TaxID=2874283 RepID=UPI001CBB2976|nr:RluA family pseudouridine synthase [Schnuerera sp. xch1]MBZ2174113.1 RluA family pseudouridine synthase [Schnuerera sp. xch1]